MHTGLVNVCVASNNYCVCITVSEINSGTLPHSRSHGKYSLYLLFVNPSNGTDNAIRLLKLI